MQTFTGTVKEAQSILDYSNGKQTRASNSNLGTNFPPA